MNENMEMFLWDTFCGTFKIAPEESYDKSSMLVTLMIRGIRDGVFGIVFRCFGL
jgi:hypothetical protein